MDYHISFYPHFRLHNLYGNVPLLKSNILYIELILKFRVNDILSVILREQTTEGADSDEWQVCKNDDFHPEKMPTKQYFMDSVLSVQDNVFFLVSVL